MRRLLGRTAATVTTLLEEGAPPPDVLPEAALANQPTREQIATMLRALGVALLQANEATNDARENVLRIARAYGIVDARVIVFPTVVFVQVPGESANRTEIESIGEEPLRLDQAGALERLVREAETGSLSASDVESRLRAIRATKAPYGWGLTVLGHTS